MFNKFEMLGAITISLIAGMAIGYSKAREICLEAIIKVTGEQADTKEGESEEPLLGLFLFSQIFQLPL